MATITKELQEFVESYCDNPENHVQVKTRTAIVNALGRAGISTLEEFRNLPEEKLKDIRGIGNERFKVLLELKGQKTFRNYFTFKVNGGEPPKVTIDGKKLAVVSCVYNWSTSTDTYAGAENTILAGYLGADPQLRMFALNFTTGISNEI